MDTPPSGQGEEPPDEPGGEEPETREQTLPGGFLPPVAPGQPPPQAPAPPPATQPGAPAPTQPGQTPPAPPPVTQPGQAPPPPQQVWSAPGYHPPPSTGYPPSGGYQQQQYWGPQPGYYPAYTEPGNGNALAGFILALASIALLLISAGLFAPGALPCAILGVVFGRKGRKAVDEGQTRKSRGLAQAGFVIGIVGIVLSVLALAGWIIAIGHDPHLFDKSSHGAVTGGTIHLLGG
jgi:hypothetical protein